MTNSKIKMAKKGVIPEEYNPVAQLLAAAKERDIVGIITAIVEMPDETFNELAEGMYKSFDRAFNSVSYRNMIANELSMFSEEELEREKEGYYIVTELVEKLETSEEKRKLINYICDLSFGAMKEYIIDPTEHIQVIYEKLNEDAIVPTYAHLGDAGADLYAAEDVVAKVGEVTFVHTGIALKIPKGYEGQVRPRSGMSAKTKIRVANAPGTIDSNYRGEVCILVDNYGSAPYVIKKGDRVAQIVFNKVPTADFIEGTVKTEVDNTRGEKGFGSSGTAAPVNE